MNRRSALTALTAAALSASAGAQQPAQPPNPPAPEPQGPLFGRLAPKRTMPMLCAYSGNLEKVPYADLGTIASQIGYEGVDLTVMIGGHVDPRVTNVDLIRAFESIRGSNLEVPMISTKITTAMDPTAYSVLYLTGHSQIPLFRMGFWQWDTARPIAQQLLQVRQELIQVVSFAQRCEIEAMFPNKAGGFVGESAWEIHSIIEQTDPRWCGYCFDPAEALIEGGLGGWETSLRLAVQRLKAVSLQDFRWEKDAGGWQPVKCPLGEGMVDWKKFFAALAAARFTGPLTIHMEYQAADALGAMTKDLEFARAQLETAWASHRGPVTN